MKLLLLSVLVALARGQLDYGDDLTRYLPPKKTYLPPTSEYRPPAPTIEDKQVIYFEKDHLINKATEPGVCEEICGSERREVITKPGTCPAIPPGPIKGACKDECKYDSECPRSQRCCDNGCARVCLEPDLHKRCSDLNCKEGEVCVEYAFVDALCVDPTPKPDLCPKIMNHSAPIGGCEDVCLHDAECDGAAKCCNNGCANRCLKPRKRGCDTFMCKVGYKCTEETPGQPTCERIPCSQDGEVVDIDCNSCTCIQGFLLCSQEVCPPTKPGFCPRLVKGYKGSCVEDCSYDMNCPGDYKCCSTGCGDTCQKPIPEIVHPCRTVRFRCGDETQCAATRGLCRPGEPCPLSPLCVSDEVPYCQSCPPGKVCVLQKKTCRGGGRCHRQPICIQLYSDDTLFEENEDVEIAIIDKQHGRHFDADMF
ncbi:kielin/chordin-like protein [Pollicipes pollicipes]|uniref:kielin/chordin-like protein n=1 Tax=Pollicipes pollicipes TaxID=41117 RepID=UPI0018855B13|nr:kielin/chordin-like protein [Pollicipes pollicipes]